ncbi:MAG: protoheme IX farnesyltransferase, partial [Terriglobus roseus]|nr:protoheme IX farnesyltransferase [Terriglobus roseus]
AGVYTPMKRISVINTWVGALVGAIPPLMGWTAAAGQYAADGTWRELLFTDQATGGWLLAALLFAWQFPHFNALSHTIRHEYANAGYRMLCSVNPARNARVALRYSLLMFPICFGLAACGIVGGGSATAPTTILWTVGSSAVNGWVCMRAVSFWRWQGEKGSARGLFWASVWHLPILLVLAMALKRGVWQRLGESLGVGRLEDDDPDDAVLPEPLAPYDARQARSGVSSVASGT